MRASLFIVLLSVAGLYAQGYLDDFAIVSRILDSNGIYHFNIVKATKADSERITWLDLRNRDPAKNFIKKIPESIGKLNRLKYLRLSYNNLTELPESIGELTELEILDLRGNKLSKLPVSMQRCSRLKKIDLRNNDLWEFPAVLIELKSLVYINLRGNEIASLPENISYLTALRELSLRNNRLTIIPTSLMRMKLTYLDLADNRLCSLPPKFDSWMKKRNNRYKHKQWCYQ